MDLVRYNRRDIDPAQLSWDPKLVFELALKTAPVQEIAAAYNLSRDEFEYLAHDPAFIKAYNDACTEVAKNGVSFKMKAALQAETLLETSWGLIHAPATPSAVKADLIKSTVRWAGLEPKGDSVGVGNALQINIMMGNRENN